jgi:hypothetical protein
MFFTSIFCGSLFCGSAVHIFDNVIAGSGMLHVIWPFGQLSFGDLAKSFRG